MCTRTYHEITLDEVQLVRKTLLLRISCGTFDLVIVVVQSSDVCAGELSNLSRRATNTASNIKNLVSILDTNLGSKIMFVAGNGLVEGFTVCESTEVERLSPTVLVEICSEVVVTGKG